jgi:hypothetical protein
MRRFKRRYFLTLSLPDSDLISLGFKACNIGTNCPYGRLFIARRGPPKAGLFLAGRAGSGGNIKHGQYTPCRGNGNRFYPLHIQEDRYDT